MAKGYPDFFGQSIFLKYGAFEVERDSATITTDALTTIAEIEAKGLLQGGSIFTADADALATDSVYLSIDGIEIFQIAWRAFTGYWKGLSEDMPMVKVYYDEDEPRFAATIKSGIPFEESVKLAYIRESANDVLVEGIIYYQVIAQ